jgi:signal transduction histidine kinase
MSPSRSLPPALFLVSASLVAAVVAVLATLYLRHQPWLGLSLKGLPTAAVEVHAGTGPGASLAPGTRLQSIQSASGGTLTVDEGDLAPEPDTRHPVPAAFNTFLARQQQLAEAIRQPEVVMTDAAQGVHHIQPRATRPLGDFPTAFWLQLFVAVSGFVIGIGVWVFRPADAAARYLAITGLGLLLSAASAAIYSSRELALPSTPFRLLHALNGMGSMLFCAAFIATLWHYPTRLGRRDPGPWLVAGYVAVSFATSLQWIPGFDLGLRLPILAGFSATIVLAVRQWVNTRARPLERAALQWFLLAWFSGSTAFLALVFVPVLFGIDTGGMQAYAFLLFLLIYIGLAFGIARYRLFELDRWWLRAWTLVLLTLVHLSISGALILGLSLDPLLAAGLAIVSAGWLYWPLRQWLQGRLAPDVVFERLIPQVLQQIVSSGATAPADLWRETLYRLFMPLGMTPGPEGLAQAQVLDNGLALEVPQLQGGGRLRLTGCQGGTRLFSDSDCATADDIRLVAERLLEYGRAVEVGMEIERQRVSRDLHDDIGARLLELLHRSEGETQGRVRSILDELRLIVTGLGSQGDTLENLLGVCRAELSERLEDHALELSWQQPAELPDLRLRPGQALLVVRCLREGADNLLRHAEATRIEVDIMCETDSWTLRLSNDGVKAPVEAVSPGRSLVVLAGRAQGLGGQLHVGKAPGGHWTLTLRLPYRAPE